MKKRIVNLSLILVFLITFIPGSAKSKAEIRLWVDGDYVLPYVAPYIENNTIMLPFFFIEAGPNYLVSYDMGDYVEVRRKDKGNEIAHAFSINDDYITDSTQKNVKLGAKIKMVNDTIMIPSSAITEMYGFKVEYDEKNNTVVVGDGYIAPSNTTNSNNQIKIFVDSKMIKTDVAPYIENGRTMVPLRFVTEALGGAVEYEPANGDGSLENITIYDPDIDLILYIYPNHRGAHISQSFFKSDVPPVIKDGRTMIPLRFIADFFGCETTWNEKTKTVNILRIGNFPEAFKKYSDDTINSAIDEMLILGNKYKGKSFSEIIK